MAFLALVTHHRTILVTDDDGVFRHRSPELGPTNVVVEQDGNRFHVIVGSGDVAVSLIRLDNPYPVFALRTANGYLSATQDGRCIEVDRLEAWEMYSLAEMAMSHGANYSPPISLSRKQRTFGIPRVIHQTSATRKVRPSVARNIEQLRSDNQGWNYMLWDDKDIHDFIYHSYGWDILKYFLRINPRYGASRADLFRYLLMYQCGGVYLDIKSSCRVPLDQLVRGDDQYILCQWDHEVDGEPASYGLWPELRHVEGGEYQQWHLIAAPGHPFLEQVILRVLKGIHNYDQDVDGVGGMAPLRVTGPIAYTLAIAPMIDGCPHRMLVPHESPLIYRNVEDYHAAGSAYRTQATPLIL